MSPGARLWAAGARALDRLREDLPALSQRTAAATIAWLIARRVADHYEPFFAPIAAYVALNTVLGDRGLNALRLMSGVIIGILSGELWLLGIGGGWISLAVATYTATVVASALGGPRIVLGQAAAGAILTVAIGKPEEGTNRLEDALIGVAVALVFSQLLFSPEPLTLLRRAESAVLTEMAASLGAARALEPGEDPALVERALANLRGLRDRLPELAQTRRASIATARHSLVWWRRKALVVSESESAGQLDLLGTSCLVLARVAVGATPAERAVIAPSLRELEVTLTDLAMAPGDRGCRQQAAERATRLAESLEPHEAPPGSQLVAARVAIRMVVVDILAFVGAEPRPGSP